MKRLLFFAALLTATVFSAHAYDFSVVIPSGQTLNFNISGNNVTIVGGSNLSGRLVIPEIVSYNGQMYNVTSINSYAFRYSSLTSVTIPNSVTQIGDYSFYGIGSLDSIIIGNGVTSFGFETFFWSDNVTYLYYNCSANAATVVSPWHLRTIVVGDSVTFFSGYENDYYDSIRNVIIGNSVTYIDNNVLKTAHNLQTVTIGRSVTAIGNNAFRFCENLDTVYLLPVNPPSLGTNAFQSINSNAVVLVPCGSLNNYINSWGTSFNFQCIPDLVFDFSINTNDSTWGTGSYVGLTDSIAEITATANYGYHFDHWSYGSTFNPDTIMLTNDDTITAFFAKNQYLVTGIANDSTKGFVTGGATVDYLDTVTLSATAHYGYQFVRWNDYSIENPRRIAATTNITKTAIFNFVQYSITVQSDNSIHGSCIGGGSYNYLSERIIQANANYGYHFTQWNDGNTNNPRTITLSQDTVFTAMFDKNNYIVTVLSEDTLKGNVFGGDTIPYLDSLTIMATANYGYHFSRWNDYNTNNPRQVQATQDKIYTAYFDCNQYSIALDVDTSIHGNVTGSGNYNYLSQRTLTATPNYGYHFTQWNDGDTSNPRVVTLTQDTAFTALFAKNFYTLTALSADTVRGAVTGGETVEYLDTVVLSASANYGYHFAQWNDGNSDNPRSLVVTQDAVYTAQFDKNSYTLSVATADSVMGDVSGSDTAEYLDIMSFAATANYGYHFTMWNDGDTNNPRSITLTQDTGFTAMFAKNLYTLTVLANDTTLGEVTGGTTAEYLDTVSITATITMPHYHFVQWSDGSTAATRNVVMTCDSVITAIFAIDTHTVTLLANDDEYGTVSGACIVPYGTEVVIVATANEGYHFAEWSNGSRNNPENIIVMNDTTLTAVFTEVVVPEIFMVTVQDGRNVVIWEKGLEVTAYNIYREGSASDVYDLVATIPYSEEPVWTDTASRPRNRSYRYRMTATDLYGYESEPGGVHKTMHLTISQGVGNEWNLVWTPYEGADYSTYVIYRGTNASNIQQIDVMPSNGNTTYTDDGAPEGTVYYQVGILLSGSTKSGDIILSNIATNETVGIHDITEVSNFNVSICNGQIVVDGAEGNQVWLYDAVGRMIATKQEDSAPIRFNVPASGTYLVKVGTLPARRVVVIR